MSDDILALLGKSDLDHLEPPDVPKEPVSLTDKHIARKISDRSRHPGKTLLEQCMEEFERFLFRA